MAIEPNRKNFNVSVPGTGVRSLPSSPNGTSININPVMVAQRTGSPYDRRKPVTRWVPPTDYSLNYLNWRRANGSLERYLSPSNWVRWSGWITSDVSNPPTHRTEECLLYGIPQADFEPTLANRALIKARNKLKGGDIHLGVAFGERRETARFVGNNLERMANIVTRSGSLRAWKAAAKRLYKHPELIARYVTDQWLELQYALKPVMSDIHGAVTVLDERPEDDWVVAVKASERAEWKVDGPQGTGTNYRRSQAKVFHGSFVRIDAVIDNAALQTAASLGLTNPLDLAWELTRLSFVVDWAYPLGSYFSSLDATLGWKIKGFSQSNLIREDWRWNGLNTTYSGGSTQTNWSAHYKRVVLNRSAGTTVPFPMLPSIKDPFSQSHVMSGLSLLHKAVVAWQGR